ncbi:hypothetical protein RYE99_01280, partial [Wolbachia endosymbiont of Drosophila seguyi]|nr:hypothetical protein [Wolbachia endosymbiont of Drosophila seguyi]MDU8922413.1 hypothetical protein [Wolbachia endosymbiont of Drosophila seguyi]
QKGTGIRLYLSSTGITNGKFLRSGISDISSSTSDDEDRTIKDKMMENVKQDNHQKSFDLHKVQATDELETVKFLKTLSKKEREKLGFSPKQQNNQKVETSKKLIIHLIGIQSIKVKSSLA